jgi:uncharacterized protein YndB with AHSA1/START domain
MKPSGTLQVTTPSDREILVTRTVNAPRRLVFEAWTDPRYLPRWMLGPPGWSMPVCEIDLRPGGTWHFVWRQHDGAEMEMRGVYKEIVPPERLVSTESWGAEWPETLNTVTLTEEAGRTKIAIRILYPSQEARDAALKTGMTEGMTMTFDRLEELLAAGNNRVDVVVTRVFHAPVERVWQAWMDPQLVMRWWGPDRFTSPFARMDFRVGGKSLVCMRAPPEFGGQDIYSTWEYRAIEPLRRIEYIHNLADKDGNKADPSRLGMPPDFPQDQPHVVTFRDLGNHQTEMIITEHGWTVCHMMEMAKMGLEQCVAKMEACVVRD